MLVNNNTITNSRFTDYGRGFLPEIILYNITMIAITRSKWIRLPKPKPPPTPSTHRSQMIIAIEATARRMSLIIYIIKK